ncbi:hypothetical protein [Planomonospora algeriensis]
MRRILPALTTAAAALVPLCALPAPAAAATTTTTTTTAAMTTTATMATTTAVTAAASAAACGKWKTLKPAADLDGRKLELQQCGSDGLLFRGRVSRAADSDMIYMYNFTTRRYGTTLTVHGGGTHTSHAVSAGYDQRVAFCLSPAGSPKGWCTRTVSLPAPSSGPPPSIPNRSGG